MGTILNSVKSYDFTSPFKSFDLKEIVLQSAKIAMQKMLLTEQWTLRDSNPRPPACKAGALPTELKARVDSVPRLQELIASACTARCETKSFTTPNKTLRFAR